MNEKNFEFLLYGSADEEVSGSRLRMFLQNAVLIMN